MNILETLRAARELISVRANWTAGAFAETGRGLKCEPHEPVACRWCAIGAVEKVTGGPVLMNSPVYYVMRSASLKLGYEYPVDLNDSTDHATVLRMFDLAIEKSEKSQ